MMAKRKIILTKRDIVILKLLYDFGVVSTEQIGRWIFKSIRRTTVLRRLRLMEDAGYIRKRATLPNATAVWIIEPDGTRILSGMPERENYPVHQLPHEMALNEIRWKFHSLDLIHSWKTERDLRKKLAKGNSTKTRSRWIVPDALVLFNGFWKEKFHARIEVELTAKSEQRYETILKSFHDTYYNTDVFTWYFVKSERMGRHILALAKKHGGLFVERNIGYTVIDDFLKNPAEAKLVMIEASHLLIRLAQEGAQALSRVKAQKTENRAA